MSNSPNYTHFFNVFLQVNVYVYLGLSTYIEVQFDVLVCVDTQETITDQDIENLYPLQKFSQLPL